MSLSDQRHQELLDWLTTYPKVKREPRTREELAKKLGVNVRTTRDWQGKPEFQKAWAEVAAQINGSPDKLMEIAEALHATAIDREHKLHVAAAKTWADLTGAVRPQTVGTGDTKVLTNDQLNKLLGERLAKEAEHRGLHVVKDA